MFELTNKIVLVISIALEEASCVNGAIFYIDGG